MTLLEMVQDIMSDLDSDDVNSITDTQESMQVAQIIKSTFYNVIDGKDWPFLFTLFQLEGIANSAKPNYMRIPDTIVFTKTIKYNKRTSTDTVDRYEEIKYKTPEEFLDLVNSRRADDSTVTQVTDFSNIPLNILNNKAPTYYTSFDDEYVVFDSYDSAVDDTLRTSKSQCYGKKTLSFDLTNTFVPDIPVQMFTYLLNESKSTASLRLKQAADQKAEQHAVSQRRRMSQEANKIAKGITYPHYGRK